MEIEDHGDEGIGNGSRNLNGQWRGFFIHAQTSHDPTNSFTYFQSCDH
jgi:hypothetical protein